jgi:four helix bundle protein
MFRFENLEIWKLASAYAKECYILANKFPTTEKFSLSSQLRRAAISISNNIVEGSAFGPVKFRSYLDISIGSALETVNIIAFAFSVGYVELREKQRMYVEAETLIKKIYSFKKSINSS